jgi:hypothetical protein
LVFFRKIPPSFLLMWGLKCFYFFLLLPCLWWLITIIHQFHSFKFLTVAIKYSNLRLRSYFRDSYWNAVVLGLQG